MTITATSLGSASATSGPSTSVITTSASVPSGSLIVFISVESGAGATGASVTDDAGNTYVSAKQQQLNASSNGYLTVWYVANAAALSSGASITYTRGSSISNSSITAFYATGIDTSSPLDTAATASAQGNSTSPSVTSGTPGSSGDLFVGVIGIIENAGTFTQDSTHGAWATPPVEISSGTTVGDRRIDGGTLVASDGTAKTYGPHYGAAHSWGAAIVAFKAATSGASTFAIAGAAALSQVGSALALGNISIAGVASLSLAGAAKALANIAVAGVGALSAAGSSLAAGVVSIAGAATAAFVNGASGLANYAIAGVGALTGVGKSLASGTVSIAGAGALSGIGSALAAGIASIAGSAQAAFSGPSMAAVATIRGISAAVFWGVGQVGNLLRVPFTDGARFSDGSLFTQYGDYTFFTLPEEGNEWTNEDASGDPWTQTPDPSNSWNSVN